MKPLNIVKNTGNEPACGTKAHNKRIHYSSLLLFFFSSFALYANTLMNGFVFDDFFTIVNNPLIKSFSNIDKLFTKEYLFLSGEATFRPFVTFTYMIDHALFGQSPWGYHLTNVLLHSINGGLVYIFLTLLFPAITVKEEKHILRLFYLNPPFLISYLYIAHPVLSEAVNAISFREELLVVFFYLTTLILYMRSKEEGSRLLFFLSCLTYSLSIFSKEMAVTLPLIVYCYELIYSDKGNKRLFAISRYTAIYGVITIAYFFLRFGFIYVPRSEYSPLGGILERVLTIPYLVLNYLKLAILPISLSADYVIIPVKRIFYSLILLMAVIVPGLFVASIMRDRRREISFGVLFFLLTLLPVFNIIPIDNPFAERYMYLPLIGFAIVFGTVIQSSRSLRHGDIICISLLSFILGMYAFNVTHRNRIWRDDYTLWADAIKKMPDSARAHSGLGFTLFERGRTEEAIKEFKTAIKLNPDYADAYNNLGNLYATLGRYEDAAPSFETVLRLNPNHPEARNNLGMIYIYQGQFNNAVRQFQTALRIKPDNYTIHSNLGFAYYKQGNLEEALQQYRKSLMLEPINPEAYTNIGFVYIGQGKLNEAIEGFRTALKFNPYYSEAYYGLGLVYNKQEKFDESIQNFQVALRLNPNSAEAHYNLGLAFFKKGYTDSAKKEFELALKLKADFLEARQALKTLK